MQMNIKNKRYKKIKESLFWVLLYLIVAFNHFDHYELNCLWLFKITHDQPRIFPSVFYISSPVKNLTFNFWNPIFKKNLECFH